MLDRGNHKSTQDDPEIVEQLLSKDVVHGFSMVTPVELAPLMPHAMVQPVGLAKQWTLNKQGNRKIKHQITQDLSCAETSKSSKDDPISINSRINSRIDMDQHPEMVHGWALPCIIHFIMGLQLAWPL
jgi:hypothetical protein